jgi:flagellar assembly protein FliH
MLSRVLRGRDPVQVAPFASVNARYLPGTAREAPGAAEGELQVLRDRVSQLESDLVAARRDSFDSGHRQGEQLARAEITQVIARMNASLADVTGLRAEMRRRAEKDVVQLALLIARRVLHRELNVDPNALTALARVVFERLARAESYRVTVHPTFVPAITAALPGTQASRVQIQPDPECAIGCLLIQSEEGRIDASVDSQLEEISRGLTDRLTPSGTAS